MNVALVFIQVCNKLCCSLGCLFLSLPNTTKHLDCFDGHASDKGQCCVMSCINQELILAGHMTRCCEGICMGAFCSFFNIEVSTWCSVKL